MKRLAILLVLAVGCGKPNDAKNGNGAAPAPAGERKGIIGQKTDEVFDLHKLMQEKPHLVVASGKVSGSDPVSAAGSAYTTQVPELSTLGMRQLLDHRQILNDRWPTYDEFMGMMRQHGIRFAQPPRYQMYAYDSETGQIVILEDPQEKDRRYKEASIDTDQ